MLEVPTKQRRKKVEEAPAEVREIGQRLRDAREAAGIKKVALARESKVDQPALSRFENGQRGLELVRLLRVLGAAARLGINVNLVVGGVAVADLDGDPSDELIAIALRLKRKHGRSN